MKNLKNYLLESFYLLLISEIIVLLSLLITIMTHNYSIGVMITSMYPIIIGVFCFWCFLNFLYITIGWYINIYKKYQNIC